MTPASGGEVMKGLQPKMVRDNKDAWWYEDSRGIEIVHEFRLPAGGAYIRTEYVRIPWGQLMAAARRSYRKRGKR